MTAIHVVRAGEHLGTIAKKFGFENFSVLWDHPENAKLKQLRGDPLLLAPGDRLFIPDHTRVIFSRLTAASHDVRVTLEKVTLRLKLLQADGKPRSNAEITLRVRPPESGGASVLPEQVLTTDADGNVSVEVAKDISSGSLVIDDVELALEIGQLDPIDTERGVEQRLINLGYLVPLEDGPEPDELRNAIEDFQADKHLPITGEREDIEAELEAAHGS